MTAAKGVSKPPPPGPSWRRYKAIKPDGGPKPSKKAPVAACAAGGGHHWRIESPSPGKPMLPGVCLKCGVERAFAATDGELGSWSEQRDAGIGGGDW